jgi:hypothetical protein
MLTKFRALFPKKTSKSERGGMSRASFIRGGGVAAVGAAAIGLTRSADATYIPGTRL